ncbi:ferritin-like domain-containing protein [Alcaligenaceae bacterium]|nr:ferritin-like domain-containing protein [Alcaligenaceae bacterium]
MHASTKTATSWTLDQVPFADVDSAQVRAQEDLFYLIAAASFVEIAADLYTDNLIRYFDGDDEIGAWLESAWRPEEVRHGHVLRDYLCHVWPEFDWQQAYSAFYADYSKLCTVEQFEASRSLEMVARCMVETGTATFYQALAALATEPVLAGIATRIRADEIGHYKYFYRFFLVYNAKEAPGRLRILGAIKRRMLEARNDDAKCALWHAFIVREAAPNKSKFNLLRAQLGQKVRRHYPLPMATKMLLKPLDLPDSVAHLLHGPMARLAARLML